MSTSFDTVVIGAGHNGLVTAAYLARAGQSVLVIEGREVVGGAAATEEIFSGFRVDSGAHRIGGLSRKVISDLGIANHGFEILSADPTVFSPVETGSPFVIWRDPVKTARALRDFSPADADAWVPFTKLINKAAGFLEAAWMVTPPDLTGNHPGDLWSTLKLGLKLRGMGNKDMVEVMRILPMSVYELLDDWFESDLVKGTLAASAVSGLHQGPLAGSPDPTCVGWYWLLECSPGRGMQAAWCRGSHRCPRGADSRRGWCRHRCGFGGWTGTAGSTRGFEL
jgi:phytoene dehydrogenase-like protein